MKKKVLIYFLWSYLLSWNLAAQTYNDKFNLDFQMDNGVVKGWMPHAANSGNKVNNDILDVARPLTVLQSDAQGIRECMNFGLSSIRNILLPELRNDIMKVAFEYKNTNIKDGKLYVYLFNKEMNQVTLDSICLQNSDDFRVDEIEIPCKDARFLFFDMKMLGNDSTYIAGKMGMVTTSIPHVVSLKSIKVYDGNTDITELDFKDLVVQPLEKQQCVDLTKEKYDFKRMSARITALGETVHGSGKINALTADYIRESVLHNNTRLLLMEGNLTLWLFFNRYIHGSDAITEEGLKLILNNAFVLDTQETLKMMKWLRDYNQTAEKPVNIIGLDTNFDITEVKRDLKAYLLAINTRAQDKIIESIASVLASATTDNLKEHAAIALETLQKEASSIDAILGRTDAQVIRYYLNALTMAVPPARDSYYKRDKMMAENAENFIGNFAQTDETIVITSHLEHANYSRTNFLPILSMGSYLRNAYGGDYRCLGELLYEDEMKVQVRGKLQIARLEKPSDDNLEAILWNTNISKLYVGSNALGELVKIRIQGTNLLPVSELDHYFNAKSQLDGFLFAR